MQLSNKVFIEKRKITYLVETDDKQSVIYILNDKGEKLNPPIHEDSYIFRPSKEDIMKNHNRNIRALLDLV